MMDGRFLGLLDLVTCCAGLAQVVTRSQEFAIGTFPLLFFHQCAGKSSLLRKGKHLGEFGG